MATEVATGIIIEIVLEKIGGEMTDEKATTTRYLLCNVICW